MRVERGESRGAPAGTLLPPLSRHVQRTFVTPSSRTFARSFAEGLFLRADVTRCFFFSFVRTIVTGEENRRSLTILHLKRTEIQIKKNKRTKGCYLSSEEKLEKYFVLCSYAGKTSFRSGKEEQENIRAIIVFDNYRTILKY